MITKFTQMTKSHFLLIFLCSLLSFNMGYSQIPKGGIMVVGFDADGTDHLTLAILDDIPENEVVYITDNEWNGSSWNTGEGVLIWTNDSGGVIPAGTIVLINASPDIFVTTGVGSLALTESSFSFTTSGDDIYIYQGAGPVDIPANFITAFSSGPDANSTLSGTGLTDGIDAIDDTNFTNDDLLFYTGSTDCSGGTLVDCSTLYATPTNYFVGDGAGDQSDDAIFPDIPVDVPSSFTPPMPVLPITLSWFKTEKIEKKAVEITWQTKQEINNEYFIIEHKTELDRDFTELTRLEGEGNSNKLKNYTWTDKSPNHGTNYYRLVQYDYDGARKAHTISAVFIAREPSLQIYPTVIMDKIHIDLGEELENNVQLVVYSFDGVIMQQVEMIKGQINMDIDCSAYPSGIYNIRITGLGINENTKLIKI